MPKAAPAPTPATNANPFDKRVQQFIMLRDKMKELDAAHEEKMKPYKALKAQLEQLMLAELNRVGADNVKVGAGTVYRTVRESATIEDGASFMRHVIGSQEFELLDRKANAKACIEFAEKNDGNLPPGIKLSRAYTVGVRRA